MKGSKLVIDVVQTQLPQLKKVIQFVCGNGLVCDTMEEARHMAFDGPERLKVRGLTARSGHGLSGAQASCMHVPIHPYTHPCFEGLISFSLLMWISGNGFMFTPHWSLEPGFFHCTSIYPNTE